MITLRQAATDSSPLGSGASHVPECSVNCPRSTSRPSLLTLHLLNRLHQARKMLFDFGIIQQKEPNFPWLHLNQCNVPTQYALQLRPPEPITVAEQNIGYSVDAMGDGGGGRGVIL